MYTDFAQGKHGQSSGNSSKATIRIPRRQSRYPRVGMESRDSMSNARAMHDAVEQFLQHANTS